MSLGMNRLSGPIPDYLGDISTLLYLCLETNMFNGTIPSSLGKLSNLQYLMLSDNYLSGEFPAKLYDLTNLIDLRLSSNNFSGQLPHFTYWRNLQTLSVQSSGFEGPIPGNISRLHNLIYLSISDLSGGSSEFPFSINMTNLGYLMLRSCNISGTIPSYISELRGLKTMDLSFNNLKGEIPALPSSLNGLYLTSNLLTGPIPTDISGSDRYVDLSYNNFSKSSSQKPCQDTPNLFRSFSGGSNSELGECLEPCGSDQYSLHINCGGKQVTIGKTKFEGDEASEGFSKFVHNANWGSSSSGEFWNLKEKLPSEFTARNISVLQMSDAEIYTTARLSPLSLTYFGYCFANGNYTVTLHFAELVIRADESYKSLGRRKFDIYIQNELRWKDFDIANEAGGVDKAVQRKFKAVVKNKTLEIRFYWAGKGTVAYQEAGRYGPLVSAISIESGRVLATI